MINDMTSNLTKKLIPTLNGGLQVLYDQVYALVFAATRAFTDTAGVSEALALTLGRNPSLSDTTSIADAGSLISQGYCDFSYFADDYVGTSRTF